MSFTSVEPAASGQSASSPRPDALAPRAGGIAFGRLPFLAIGFLSLLAGIWGGLFRAGWAWPVPPGGMVAMHGPLIVCGFLGTLIGLERAVALGGRWVYLAPALTGLGGLALIAGAPWPAGPALLLAGSLLFTVANLAIYRRQPAAFTGVMALGAAAWAVGNALWLAGSPVPVVVLWWAAFLILTIAGERLELSRLTGPGDRGRWRFLAAAALLVAGAAAASLGAPAESVGAAFGDPAGHGGGGSALLSPDTGFRVAGAAMIGMVLWLAGRDTALRTVRIPGLPRFVAVNILAGYAWLAAAGCLAVAAGGMSSGLAYDAFLHMVFLGFVFAMIFGHAPIILPAVLRVPVAFRHRFWAHVALLQASVLLRVGADAAGWFDGRRAGALLNGLAVVLFLGSTALAIVQATRQAAERRRPAGP